MAEIYLAQCTLWRKTLCFCGFLTIHFFISSARSQEVINFEHWSADNGLSQNSIKCIYQDRKGFIWIGTRDGLNMFDGYQFTVYRNNPKNPESISFNIITLVLEQGSVIYLTSDGYTDQNNAAREKLGTPKLLEFFKTSHALPLSEQKLLLEKNLDEHQQGTQQRDDITLIGVRI